MRYLTNLFTVDTYEYFLESDRTISGFSRVQRTMASKVEPGDILCCYLKGLSRWAAYLRVLENFHEDDTPIFTEQDDPFVLRFRVEPAVVLPFHHAVPIKDPRLFDHLSFTRDNQDGYWLGPLRRSLHTIQDEDGELLVRTLDAQLIDPDDFPITERELAKHRTTRVSSAGRMLGVVVTDDDETDDAEAPVPSKSDSGTTEHRKSHQIQGALASLGLQLKFDVWLPMDDRARCVAACDDLDGDSMLNVLPLNYNDATNKVIQRIDVLWLRRNTFVRAFEVEHTTSIFSGLLRMADLLALQPGINIKLHIVAAQERREKVIEEIQRPVFTMLEGGPLSERCTYLAYDSVEQITAEPNIVHMKDSILETYEEAAE